MKNKTNVKLKNNQSINFYGSRGEPYTIERKNDVTSCTCMAWKVCKGNVDEKICKHIIAAINSDCWSKNVSSRNINKANKA